jgi:hypothetical protein
MREACTSAALTTIHDLFFPPLPLIFLSIFLSKISPFYLFPCRYPYSFRTLWLLFMLYMDGSFKDRKGRFRKKYITHAVLVCCIFSLLHDPAFFFACLSCSLDSRSLTHLYIRCLIPEVFRECVLHHRRVQKPYHTYITIISVPCFKSIRTESTIRIQGIYI